MPSDRRSADIATQTEFLKNRHNSHGALVDWRAMFQLIPDPPRSQIPDPRSLIPDP
jgi:hypothetical protein